MGSSGGSAVGSHLVRGSVLVCIERRQPGEVNQLQRFRHGTFGAGHPHLARCGRSSNQYYNAGAFSRFRGFDLGAFRMIGLWQGMHGFSADSNFRFLLGSIVEQVCLGQYETQIRLRPGVTISLEGRYIHRIGTREIVQERSSSGPNELFRLLGQTVTDATVMPPKSLAIGFSNGDSLTLTDDSDQYESFTIGSPEGGYIVI